MGTKTAVSKSTYKAVITTVVTLFSGAILLVGGVFIGNLFSAPEQVDYEEKSYDELVDNQLELMNRYNAIKDNATINDFLETFKPYELANIGFNKIADHDHYCSVGIGLVNAMGVKQTIRGYTIKDYDKYFYENLSKSSMVQVAKRFYQQNGSVDLYEGKLKDTDSATWNSESKKTQSVSDYAKSWGKDLSVPCVYTISSKTSLNTSLRRIEDNKVYVELDLDSHYSTLNYVKQMKMTSSLEEYPVFSSVHLQVILDDKLNLLENTATEAYKVKKGVWASAKGELRNVCHYDDNFVIPDLSTDCIYE